MASLGKNWKYVEIGVSKGSRWLCEMFLTSRLFPLVFHLRNIHGKPQPGWTLPLSCDAEIQVYMIRLLDEELEEVLMKSYNSMPVRSGSDSDEHEQTLPRSGCGIGFSISISSFEYAEEDKTYNSGP